MPVPDNEPQYWLRDSSGNLVGAFCLDSNGDPAIVDENGNEASLEGDGTWDVPAVTTESQSITGDVIEVYGQSGQFFKQYDIASYSDILAAMQQAVDDLPARGGSIRFSGHHTASSQLVIDKPVSINPVHGHAAARGPSGRQGDEIEWTGGTTTPIVLRLTADSPDNVALQGAKLGQFALYPSTTGNGDTAILLDGTSETFTGGANGGSIVRECEISAWAHGWGGSNPTIWGKGTVFDIYHDRPGVSENSADGLVYEDVGTATLGPPSGIYLYEPRLYTTAGTWGAKLATNTGAVFGGRVQQIAAGAHGIAMGDNAGGGIRGTKFEGTPGSFNGGIAYQVLGPATRQIVEPSRIANYETGVDVGDGSGTQIQSIHINTDFEASGTEDVKIRGGGNRAGLKILCPTPNGITDNRNVDQFGEGTFHTGFKGSRAYVRGNDTSRPGSPRDGQLYSVRFDGTTQTEADDILDHWNANAGQWESLHPLTGTYSGDGTTGHGIECNRRPRQVIIDDGTNSVLAFRGGTTIPLRGTVGGSVSFDATGFTVSDGGSDAFPNTSGVTYDFIVE